MNKKEEKKIISKLLVNEYIFKIANGMVKGYGKNYREAARNLVTNKKSLEVGMLVVVRHPNPKKPDGYWDGREFLKEVERGNKTKVTEGHS